MLVLMNTRHYVDRAVYASRTIQPIDYTYTYPWTINADYNDPYTGPCSAFWCCSYTCTRRSIYTVMASSHTAVANWCDSTLLSELTTYMLDYNDDIYSWSTCDYYYYDYNRINCLIPDIDFNSCTASSGTLGSAVYHSSGIYASWEDCTWVLGLANSKKPWYTS